MLYKNWIENVSDEDVSEWHLTAMSQVLGIIACNTVQDFGGNFYRVNETR